MCKICDKLGNQDTFEMHCHRLGVEYAGWGSQMNHFKINGEEHHISWHTYDANPLQFDYLVKAIKEATDGHDNIGPPAHDNFRWFPDPEDL